MLIQLLQPQRPVHFNSAFTQAHLLLQQPDLHPQFTFSRILSGATGIVLNLTNTWPFLISQPKSANDGGDMIAWSAHFQIYAWYKTRLVCSNTSFVQDVVLSEYWPRLNRLDRAILISSSHNCPYKIQTYLWICWNTSFVTVHVDPSDLNAGKKSGYFSNVLNFFLFPLQAILRKLLGFLKRLGYLGILFSEIQGIIYKKIGILSCCQILKILTNFS